MNKVILSGRLVKDPELRISSEKAVVRFTIAVPRQFKKDEADFVNCVAFGKTGETINEYMKKGSGISLVGNLRLGSYDAQDGTKRYTTDVLVENFEFPIGGANKEADAEDSKEKPKSKGNKSKGDTESFDDDITPIDDDDMPF